MIKFLLFACLFLVIANRTSAYPLGAYDEETDPDFDYCQSQSDCRPEEFCLQKEPPKRGICVSKIAKTIDSISFDPMDVNIVNEQPIALP